MFDFRGFALGTVDLAGFVIAQTDNNGEGMATLIAKIFVGRHRPLLK